MQFTGLKDKNGKEIFEGDILRLYYLESKTIDGAEVVFSHDGGWVLKSGSDFLNIGTRQDEVEIIGNIYENPELIGNGNLSCFTLDQVLIALEKSYEGKDGCFGLNFHHGLFDSWWITISKSTMGYIDSWICKWDLTKLTLKEQPKQTQLSIIKLLKNDK
jgi:hypothetical protein